MKCLIVSDSEYLIETLEKPVVGRKYYLEDATDGTQEQNKAFHSLLNAYWVSGQHKYTANNFDDFRDMIKRDLGAGFISYIYATDEGIKKVKKYEDIPLSIRKDKRFILGKLKSWSRYTVKQRTSTIDTLIADMLQAGVSSKKFHEILDGMEKRSKQKNESKTVDKAG